MHILYAIEDCDRIANLIKKKKNSKMKSQGNRVWSQGQLTLDDHNLIVGPQGTEQGRRRQKLDQIDNNHHGNLLSRRNLVFPKTQGWK